MFISYSMVQKLLIYYNNFFLSLWSYVLANSEKVSLIYNFALKIQAVSVRNIIYTAHRVTRLAITVVTI
uniref:Putative secreted protein n=1 Tax=Panstrongylus lignarius TaxID=156445 RepID=A0A224Y6S9_9HEMI